MRLLHAFHTLDSLVIGCGCQGCKTLIWLVGLDFECYTEATVSNDMQSMVSDGLASVRCAALRCLAKVLSAVENLVPSDAKVFTE